MSKKILSVVLFAAMMLSMVSVANAADPVAAELKPTKLLYVAVSNSNADDAANVTIAPPGSLVGIMLPGVYDKDEITITGKFDDIINREFEVAIVLNGLLDTRNNNIDKVWVNDTWVDISKPEVCGVTDDGLHSIIYTKFYLSWNRYMDDMSSDKQFFVKVVKDGGSSFDFKFKINYVDDSFTAGLKAGIDYEDYSTNVGDVLFYVEPAFDVVAGDDADVDYTVANAIVDVNTKLNIRSGPGTNFAVIGQLDDADGVYVLSVDGNWAALADDDGVLAGYVHTRYLIAL